MTQTPHVCDRVFQYHLSRITAHERNRPVPKDVGACDWRGMTDDDIAALDHYVCPKHRETIDETRATAKEQR
jgi:hypothetical protein